MDLTRGRLVRVLRVAEVPRLICAAQELGSAIGVHSAARRESHSAEPGHPLS